MISAIILHENANENWSYGNSQFTKAAALLWAFRRSPRCRGVLANYVSNITKETSLSVAPQLPLLRHAMVLEIGWFPTVIDIFQQTIRILWTSCHNLRHFDSSVPSNLQILKVTQAANRSGMLLHNCVSNSPELRYLDVQVCSEQDELFFKLGCYVSVRHLDMFVLSGTESRVLGYITEGPAPPFSTTRESKSLPPPPFFSSR